jgi:tRNA(Ser,Leu) C12 N-acetylase TAN1
VTIKDDEIEDEARAMLREQIERTPWFKVRMTKEQRRAAIEQKLTAIGTCSCPKQ